MPVEPPPPVRYWVLTGDVPNGPFDIQQLYAKLASGEIAGVTQVCPFGGNSWFPLSSIPGIVPVAPSPIPHDTSRPEAVTARPRTLTGIPITIPITRGSPSQTISQPRVAILDALPVERVTPPAQSTSAVIPSRPWNPALICWLGVLFSPVWAGIMAAMNGRRLGMNTPSWRPIALGLGSVVADIGISFVYESYLVSAVLYLGALGLIWGLDLNPQAAVYRQRMQVETAGGGWLVPSLVGVPLALLVLFAFVVYPLMPLEPRQVCEKFAQARTEQEMKKYATLNLWPALATLAKMEDSKDPGEFELTGEEPAPANVGGYLVGHRMVFKEGGNHTQVEGVFHLVDRQGEWKIEDIYFTSINRQPLEDWLSIAKDYQQMAAASRDKGKADALAKMSPKTPASAQKEWYENRGVQHAAGRGISHFFSSGGGKAVGVVLLGIIVALFRFGKEILNGFGSRSKS